MAGTKWAETVAFDVGALAGEIRRTLGTVGGDDDPAPGYRIFSQLRHDYYLTTDFRGRRFS
jgi:hypothetical protein